MCVCFWTYKLELAQLSLVRWMEDKGGLKSCLQNANTRLSFLMYVSQTISIFFLALVTISPVRRQSVGETELFSTKRNLVSFRTRLYLSQTQTPSKGFPPAEEPRPGHSQLGRHRPLLHCPWPCMATDHCLAPEHISVQTPFLSPSLINYSMFVTLLQPGPNSFKPLFPIMGLGLWTLIPPPAMHLHQLLSYPFLPFL